MDRFIPKGDIGRPGGWLNLNAADLRRTWEKAGVSVTGDPKKTFTLEVRPGPRSE